MRKNSGIGALLLMLVMSAIIVLPVLVHLIIAASRQTNIDKGKLLFSEEAAQSGLAEALGWFRRQGGLPVASGMPYVDGAFAPTQVAGTTACCTLDPALGLVGEYLISSSKNVWARYEVHRQALPPPAPADPLAAHDITTQWFPSSFPGSGLAWSLTSIGYSFRKVDPTKPFDQAPNQVLNKAQLSIDIGYVALNLPSQSALIAPTTAQFVLDPRLIINGGTGAAITVIAGTSPDLSNLPVQGSPNFQVQPMMSLTLDRIFGMNATQLRRFANEVIDPRASYQTPDSYSGIASGVRLTYVRKNPSIAQGIISLNGTGVVVVDSDALVKVTGIFFERSGESVGVNAGNTFLNEGIFTGVIVHNGSGDLLLTDGLIINGAIVVTGTGRVKWGAHTTVFLGNGGGGVSLNYSDQAIEDARLGVGYKPKGIPLRGRRL